MHALLATGTEVEQARPIHLVTPGTLPGLVADLPQPQRHWVATHSFAAGAGRHLVVPAPDGTIAAVLFGIEGDGARHRDPFLPAKLVTLLPPGVYRFAAAPQDAHLATLGWLTGSHRFTRYKAGDDHRPRLVAPDGVDAAAVSRIADAVAMGRVKETPLLMMQPTDAYLKNPDLKRELWKTLSSLLSTST